MPEDNALPGVTSGQILPTPAGYLTPEQELRYGTGQRHQLLFKAPEYRSWTQPIADILAADADRRYYEQVQDRGIQQAESTARSSVSGLPGSDDLPEPSSTRPSTGLGILTDPIQRAFGGGTSGIKDLFKSGQRPAQGTAQSQSMPDDAYLDPGFMRTVGHLESGNNPNEPRNPQGNRGLYQWSRDLEKKYGITDDNWQDPVVQRHALHQEVQEHSKALTDQGINPTQFNLWMLHNQGIGGGPALLKADPDTPAYKALTPRYGGNEKLAKSAISNNFYEGMSGYGKPVEKITAGEFLNGWQQKFANTYARVSGDPNLKAGVTPQNAPRPPGAIPQAPVAAGGPTPQQAPLGATSTPGVMAPAAAPPPTPPAAGSPLIRAMSGRPSLPWPTNAQQIQATPAPGQPAPRAPMQFAPTQAPAAGSPQDVINQRFGPPGQTTIAQANPLTPPTPPPAGGLPPTAAQPSWLQGGQVGNPGAPTSPTQAEQSALAGTPAPPGGQPTGTPTPGVTTLPDGRQFIAPTQKFDPNITKQIYGMIRDRSNPYVQQEGYKLLTYWNQQLKGVTQVERGGKIFQGNPYNGFTETNIPAKPEVRDLDIPGGMKLPMTPTYDQASGKQTGWKVQQITGPGGQPQAPPAQQPLTQREGETPDQLSFRKAQEEFKNAPQIRPTLDEIANDPLGAGTRFKAYNESDEDYRKKYARLHDLGQTSSIAYNQGQLLEKVLQNPRFISGHKSGLFKDWQQVAASLGLSKGEEATLMSVADKLGAGQMVNDIREIGSSGQGVVRQTEAGAVEKSQFSLDKNTPEANLAIVRNHQKMQKRGIEVPQLADAYAQTHNNRLDQGFDSKLSQYYRDKPLYNDEEIKAFTDTATKPAAPVTGPAAPPQKAIDYLRAHPDTGAHFEKWYPGSKASDYLGK